MGESYYYPRFGFERGATDAQGNTFDVLMCLPLNGEFKSIKGKLIESEDFEKPERGSDVQFIWNHKGESRITKEIGSFLRQFQKVKILKVLKVRLIMKLIERGDYLKRLIRLKGTPDIKIIAGLRRSGKSELVRSYIEWLKKNSSDDNVIYIDFYDLKNDKLKTYRALYEYVEKNWKTGKNNTLIVDEVQLCDQFELAIIM